MAAQDPVAAGRELIEAFGAGDWDRWRAVLASDVLYEETGTGRRAEGADAYTQLVQGWKQAFPDARGAIGQEVGGGGTAALEVTWEGTHRGELAAPGATLAASGRRISVPAAVWVRAEGGQIRAVRHHLDMLTMLQQLGAIPAPGQAPG